MLCPYCNKKLVLTKAFDAKSKKIWYQYVCDECGYETDYYDSRFKIEEELRVLSSKRMMVRD